MNQSLLARSFSLYLKAKSVSPATLRNYLADTRHFLSWLDLPFDDPYKIAQSITGETFKKYQQFLQKNNIAVSTINRRFSALRQLGRFFISQGWLKKNLAKKVSNITAEKRDNFPQQLMKKFAKSLKSEGKSSTTIRNYLSDVRGYLEWNKKIPNYKYQDTNNNQ
ncbi:MAG: site-specific integrase [Candidatus Helarchaeota archaeon]